MDDCFCFQSKLPYASMNELVETHPGSWILVAPVSRCAFYTRWVPDVRAWYGTDLNSDFRMVDVKRYQILFFRV